MIKCKRTSEDRATITVAGKHDDVMVELMHIVQEIRDSIIGSEDINSKEEANKEMLDFLHFAIEGI